MDAMPARPSRNRASTTTRNLRRVVGRGVLNDQNARLVQTTNSTASMASSSSPTVCTCVCAVTSRSIPMAVRQTPTMAADTAKTCIVRSCSRCSDDDSGFMAGGCGVTWSGRRGSRAARLPTRQQTRRCDRAALRTPTLDRTTTRSSSSRSCDERPGLAVADLAVCSLYRHAAVI